MSVMAKHPASGVYGDGQNNNAGVQVANARTSAMPGTSTDITALRRSDVSPTTFPLLKTSVIYVNPCCAVAKDVESASTFHFLLLKNCKITQYKRKVLVPMLSSIGSHHHSLLFSSSKLWICLEMSTTSL